MRHLGPPLDVAGSFDNDQVYQQQHPRVNTRRNGSSGDPTLLKMVLGGGRGSGVDGEKRDEILCKGGEMLREWEVQQGRDAVWEGNRRKWRLCQGMG